MIQRIQTIFLLLTIVIAFLFLSGDMVTFLNGDAITFKGIKTGINQFVTDKTLGTWPLIVLSLIVPIVALITIFLYKRRVLQMNFTLFLILVIILQIGAVVYFSLAVSKKFDTAIDYGIKVILPVIMLILSILAYRGIKKDEKLVKSYDRLR